MVGITRRKFFTIAAASGVGATTILAATAEEALAQAVRQAVPPTFTLLLVNDIYQMNEVKGRGGFARLTAIARAERAKRVPLLYAHAGDMFSPSLMSGFDQGAHTIELLNVVPPDVFVPGNHEFDFGPEIYAQRRAESRFPYFAANLRGVDGAPLPGHEDRRIFELGPLKVGVLGVALASSPLMSKTGNLKFIDELETVQSQAGALRQEGSDLVVAVTHTGFARDIEIMRSGLVDFLLTGHDHDLRVVYDNKVGMVESGEEGEYVTAIDVYATIGQTEGRRHVAWRPNFRVIDSASVTPDRTAQAIVKRLEADLARDLDVVIGRTTVQLDTRSASVRSQETLVGNLIADAIRLSTGAQISLLNGGSIRGNRVYQAWDVLAIGHLHRGRARATQQTGRH